jgi:hypothetical protein
MGPTPTTRYPSAYFRTHFELSEDPADILSLQVAVNYDDGFVLWLNGVELARRGLSGTVSYASLASLRADRGFVTIDVSALDSLLVPGTNTLAAEVHQASLSSSDLAWDAELSYENGSPSVTRGPYLAMGTPDAMTIRWRTGVPTDSRVWLGPVRRGSLPPRPIPHRRQSTNCASADFRPPRTTFTRRLVLRDPRGNDPETWFDTAPAPGGAGPTRVWVLGDSGDPGKGSGACATRTTATPTAGRPMSGSCWGTTLTTAGTDAEFEAGLFDPYASFLRTHALWPTRGNHDVLHDGADDDYYDLFTMPEAGQAGACPPVPKPGIRSTMETCTSSASIPKARTARPAAR